MSEPFLKKEIIVGCTASNLVFADPITQLEVSISGWHRRLAINETSQMLIETRSALSAAQYDELLDVLDSAGFLVDEDHPEVAEPELSPWAVQLAEAVAAPTALPRGKFCLIHTANEALILPSGFSDPTAAESLRLFVSGIRPLNLRRCYAFGASSGSVSVLGDCCSSDHLNKIREEYGNGIPDPVVVSLKSGKTSSFARAPGRLHPAQLVVERRIEFNQSLVLHQCGVALACPDLRFCDVDPDPWAWGHASDAGLARTKAISEATERYATGTVPYRRLVKARAVDLDAPYLDPRDVISFSASQRERHPELREFLPEDERYWVLGETGDEQPVYILADLVFNPFVPPDINDQRVHCRVSSSGVAYGRDKESAKKRALLECVERDAFLRIWYTRLSPPQLNHRSISEFGQRSIESLQKLGWEVSLLILPGAAPVIAAIGVSEKAMLIGCAAGHAIEATEKALTELSVALTGLPPLIPMRADQISKAEDHTMLYRNKNIRRCAGFLSASKTRLDVSDLSWDGKFTIGSETYFVRLPTIDEGADHVWRAINPDLIPMTFGYDSEPRGREDVARAVSEAASLGHLMFTEEDVLIPHPFA